jgi:hypothetical protein
MVACGCQCQGIIQGGMGESFIHCTITSTASQWMVGSTYPTNGDVAIVQPPTFAEPSCHDEAKADFPKVISLRDDEAGSFAESVGVSAEVLESSLVRRCGAEKAVTCRSAVLAVGVYCAGVVHCLGIKSSPASSGLAFSTKGLSSSLQSAVSVADGSLLSQ